jgi:hypothetical protein
MEPRRYESFEGPRWFPASGWPTQCQFDSVTLSLINNLRVGLLHSVALREEERSLAGERCRYQVPVAIKIRVR